MRNEDWIDAITVDIRKTLDVHEDHFKDAVVNCAGKFYPDDEVITLFYGDFFKELCTKHKRSIEKQTCNTISHEILHYILLEEQNIKVCARFDRIAEDLKEYGVW